MLLEFLDEVGVCIVPADALGVLPNIPILWARLGGGQDVVALALLSHRGDEASMVAHGVEGRTHGLGGG